jgi:hypothetical protein
MNGHKNWNHWNVSLWLTNDEELYKLISDHVMLSATLDEAAIYILHELKHHGADYPGVVNSVSKIKSEEDGGWSRTINKQAWTPDGAPYTLTSIRAALKGFR